MPQDKYSAVWVSHSSMGDFLKCPRLYYLKNVYKDPKTRHKIQIVNPALSLGVSVHEVLEGLGDYPAETRMSRDILGWFDEVWKKVSGKVGGFTNAEQEKEYKDRGIKMLEKVIANPGPLLKKRIKLPENEMLPNYYLDEENNIILCGKLDWMEYIDADDSIKILDFKTGKLEEKEESLQLPIYELLVSNLQKRRISGAAYWYLDEANGKSGMIVDVPLVPLDDAYKMVHDVALKVKEVRTSGEYHCPKGSGGCLHCKPFEKILRGEAEFVGVGGYKQDLYLVE